MNVIPVAEPAFHRLRRDLVRRRLAGLDLRLRGEIVLLAAIVGAFLFWQTRVPFDGLRRAHDPVRIAFWQIRISLHGSTMVALALSGILAFIAAANAALIMSRHARQLRSALPGPPWLTLPLPPERIVEHLAWEARLLAVWGVAAAPGFLVAAIGLVPAWVMVLVCISFVAALWGASLAATRIATRWVLRTARRTHRAPDVLLDLLSEARSARTRTGLRATRWGRAPAWRALWRKDARLALRPTPARVRLAAPLVFGATSCAIWLAPLPPPAAHALAFATSLLAAATLAEFLIALAGIDPLPVLHALPIGAWTVWTSRVAWVLLGAGLLVGGQALCARSLEPSAFGTFMVWLTCAAIAIALLGVHYGMTLGSNAAAAQRFLALTLSISMAASLMIPLMGWIVLLTAVIHSARRVPRWSRIEAER